MKTIYKIFLTIISIALLAPVLVTAATTTVPWVTTNNLSIHPTTITGGVVPFFLDANMFSSLDSSLLISNNLPQINLQLNLNNPNTWTASQVFTQGIDLQGSTLSLDDFDNNIYGTGLGGTVVINNLASFDQLGNVTATRFNGIGTSLTDLNGANVTIGVVGTANGGTAISGTPSYGNILVGNNSGTYTLTATSGLKIAVTDTTGTLPVSRGGTNATTFGQGWLESPGGTNTIISSTSPTVNYITATSTTATSTFAGGIVGANNFTVQSSSGNVGIGTLNPGTKLEVNAGAAQAGINVFGSNIPVLQVGQNASNNLQLYWFSGTGYIGTYANAAPLNFSGQSLTFAPAQAITFTPGSTYNSIFSAGNVGIGTTLPLRKLAIKGTGTDTGFIEFHNSANDIPFVGIGYDQTNDGLSVKLNSGSTDFNSTAMFIARGGATNGNVGIGATTLPFKEVITGTSTAGSLQQWNSSAGEAMNLTSDAFGGIMKLDGDGSASVFGNYFTIAGATRGMSAVKYDGTVKVNMAAHEGVDFGNDMFMGWTDSGAANGGTTAKIGWSSSRVLKVFDDNSNLSRLLVGSLGVGTTTPTYALEVNGTSTAKMFECGGNPTLTGDVGAGSGYTITLTTGSTDCDGEITVLTAGTPVANSVVAKLTYQFAGKQFCTWSDNNGSAAQTSGLQNVFLTNNTGNFTLTSGSTILGLTTTYKWGYHCGGSH